MSDNEQNDRNIESITKLLTDLKVTELKSELETRGLDTNGIKAVLADRLQEHLEEQGHDVEIFDFNSPEDRRSIEPKNEEDEDVSDAEEAMETEEENQEDVSKDLVEEYPRESSEPEMDSSNDSLDSLILTRARLQGRKPKNEEDEDVSEEIPEQSQENPLMETEAENQENVPKDVVEENPRESLESQEESSNDSSEDDENVQKETSMVFSEDGDDEFSLSPEDFRTVVDLMEESQESHEQSLEKEILEESLKSQEKTSDPDWIPEESEKGQLEKIAEEFQNGPVALVEIRQETHETFQEGFLEEIQTPRGIAGCLFGVVASVAAVFGLYRGTSHITPLGNDEAPSSTPKPEAQVPTATSAKSAESASSADNETPSFLSQILEWIRSIVREFFRRLFHGTPYQLA